MIGLNTNIGASFIKVNEGEIMKKIGIKWKAEHMPSQVGKTVIVTGANTGIGYLSLIHI